jgi:hypothetical protein
MLPTMGAEKYPVGVLLILGRFVISPFSYDSILRLSISTRYLYPAAGESPTAEAISRVVGVE